MVNIPTVEIINDITAFFNEKRAIVLSSSNEIINNKIEFSNDDFHMIINNINGSTVETLNYYFKSRNELASVNIQHPESASAYLKRKNNKFYGYVYKLPNSRFCSIHIENNEIYEFLYVNPADAGPPDTVIINKSLNNGSGLTQIIKVSETNGYIKMLLFHNKLLLIEHLNNQGFLHNETSAAIIVYNNIAREFLEEQSDCMNIVKLSMIYNTDKFKYETPSQTIHYYLNGENVSVNAFNRV